ncbi:sensor histidine kinase [Bacillus marasmi]|uniref:sensor histidine kinase n=1 Tax=Bacillus marasmi TaxID=1926279 RepID=UPI00164E21EB|nr:HAMP domain-containing histidine kinase [Bacillus marasmi]
MNIFAQISIAFWVFLAAIITILIFIIQIKTRQSSKVHLTDHSLLDINEELDTVIKSVHSTSTHQDIKIKYYSTLEQATFIKGNRNNFHLALLNLVKNGLDASQNGSIEIAVHEMLSSILIVIEHNGRCFTNEQIKKLNSILPGTDVINSMKGKIEVVSQQGQGTILSVKIPKAPGFTAKTI